MEFLASLAIKVLVGTSICGTVTVGTIYKCDRTLLGFEPLTTKTNTGTSGQGASVIEGDQSKVSGRQSEESTFLGQVNQPTSHKVVDAISADDSLETSNSNISTPTEGALAITTPSRTLNNSENQLANTPSDQTNPTGVVTQKVSSDSEGETVSKETLITDTSLDNVNEEEKEDNNTPEVINGVVKPDANSGESVDVGSTKDAISKKSSESVEKPAAKVVTELESTDSEDQQQQTFENVGDEEIGSEATHS